MNIPKNPEAEPVYDLQERHKTESQAETKAATNHGYEVQHTHTNTPVEPCIVLLLCIR